METTYNKDIAHCSGYCCLLSDQCRRYHLFRAWERRKLPPAPFIMACFDMDTETCPNFLHLEQTTPRKMEKKKIVITLSRVFPTTHSRKGQPTGFKEKLASGCKLHTIRGNFDQWNAIAEKMQRGGYCCLLSDQCRRYHLFRAWERRKLPPAPAMPFAMAVVGPSGSSSQYISRETALPGTGAGGRRRLSSFPPLS